jgi:hypothetical protein
MRRSARPVIAVSATAAVAAAIALPLAFDGHSHPNATESGPSVGSSHHAHTVPIADRQPMPRTSLDPSRRGQDRAWLVAAPLLGDPSQPAPVGTPCRAGQIHATARTRPIPDGVAAVVTLTGRHCTPTTTSGPVALQSANGERLAVKDIGGGSHVDPPVNFPMPSGWSITWGLAWRGSWCGAHARSVVLRSPRIIAPLSGPSPACHGESTSVLVPGVAGTPGGDGIPRDQTDPVQPAPADWAGLRAKLHVPAIHSGVPITGLSVTLRNPTSAPIVLAPCPAYRMLVNRPHSGEVFGARALTCPSQPRVVPAHGAIRIPLRGRQGGPARAHHLISFSFAIADVPVSTVQVRVR